MNRFHLSWFLGTGFGVQSWQRDWDGDLPASWMQADFYTDMVRSLERACFDYLIIEDTSMVPDRYGDSAEIYLQNAMTAPKHDPVPLASILTQVTSRLGIIPTISTTFTHPFAVARLMSTLDHLSKGRIGWNVVTSSDARAAENYGIEMPAHDRRYDRAEEFVAAVQELWASWEPDSVVLDHETGTYADFKKVHATHFEGDFFRSRGPLNTIPSPQGRPVICQAGSSPRGREFSSKNADTIIASTEGVAKMKSFREDVRARAAAWGRNPDDCKVLYLVSPILGETDDEAEAKRRRMRQWSADHVDRVVASMSYNIGIDFSTFDLDAPLGSELTTNGHLGTLMNLVGDGQETLRQRVERYIPWESTELVGSPTTVARQMAEVMEEVGGDGFLISRPWVDRRFVTEVTDGLVPALQKLGLVRTSYSHEHFRDNLLDF
jgi:FMN-dependent oxidoreductase (nitrilotriacetate monooxygenase family)